MQQHDSGSWKRSKQSQKSLNWRSRGITGLAFFGFGSLISLYMLSTGGFDGDGFNPLISLLVCLGGFAAFLPLAILPGRAQRKEEAAEAKRIRNLQYNPNSQWDNYLQSVAGKGFLSSLNLNIGAVSSQAFKQGVVLPTLASRVQSPVFLDPASINLQTITAGGIFGTLSKTKMNDPLSASYQNVPFMQADLTCCHEVYRSDDDGGGRYEDVEIFKGRWLYLTSQKSLASGFYLYSKNFEDVGGRKGAAKRGMQPVSLDDARFNSSFDVYAFDAHDAFRFLTPTLLEQLCSLCQTESGEESTHSVALMAVGTSVQVVINGVADAFEPGINLKALIEEQAQKRVNAEIDVATDTIDAMLQSLA